MNLNVNIGEKAAHLMSGLILMLSLSIAAASHANPALDERERKPNFIIIFTDDLGYGDLGCFGSEKIKTPNLDRMAREGCRFTNFMVAAPMCTPSRAALLTGSYPKRVGLHKGVLYPDSKIGLNPDEYTIADHMKTLGYATACFGKWHLGHHKQTLPQRNGFDEYYGIPYSNDMNHGRENMAGGKLLWSEPDLLWMDQKSAVTKWNTPLVEGDKITELPTDQRTVTRRYTDQAIEFVKKNVDRPFFLYLPHSMPHVPLYVPEDAYDPNPKNAYTCTIQHIDSETGRLLDLLRETGLDKDTYVIFTSDNGPWTYLGHHAGSAGPLRGHKSQTYEGGMRVPCIMWAPGRIPAETVCDQLAVTFDLLPTIAKLTGSELPKDRMIDGVDISGLMKDPMSKTPREEFLYYSNRGLLEGIRQGNWKLRKSSKQSGSDELKADPPEYDIELYDLANDIGEQSNLAENKRELVTKLSNRMQELDAEIEKNDRPVWSADLKSQ